MPKASLDYLSSITLESTEESNKKIRVGFGVGLQSYGKPMVLSLSSLEGQDEVYVGRLEAAELSSIKDQLDAKNVGLYAIVHETLGVAEFKDFFKGQVFFDPERRFYGPNERWASICGAFRPRVLLGYIRASRKGVSGNFEGEGRLLGGLFVIGPGSQGVLLEHYEEFFGDHATNQQVLEAVEKIRQQ